MPESTIAGSGPGRWSRLGVGLFVGGLQAIGLRQPALKLKDSLTRRSLGQIVGFEIKRCRRYMSSLGRTRGFVTYLRCNYPRLRGDSLIRVRAPELESPLTIRAATPDVIVFEQVYVDRLHDVEPLFEPKLIVDAGAHIGCVTASLAARFPRSKILAIEPDSANYTLLARNIAPYPNVLPIRAAIWHRPAVLSISNPEDKSWAFQMRQVSRGETGTTIGLTIPEILKWLGSSDIDILKLDLEGEEREIFEAAASEDWLRRVREIRVELHERMVPGCEEAVDKALAGWENCFSRLTSGEYTILRRTAGEADSRKVEPPLSGHAA
jgi:FkbM family methyltransferase